jgi:hypothetical protein
MYLDTKYTILHCLKTSLYLLYIIVTYERKQNTYGRGPSSSDLTDVSSYLFKIQVVFVLVVSDQRSMLYVLPT